MTIEQLKNKLPDCAKDIKLNLSTVLREEESQELSFKQIYSIALACSYTTQNQELIDVLSSEAKQYLSDKEIEATKASAIIMAMNNVYYRFTHSISDRSFSSMPARLRMNVMANPGISKTDFELNCLAVSAINGCALCMDSHTKELFKAGLSKIAIQSAVRIASVIHATDQSLVIWNLN